MFEDPDKFFSWFFKGWLIYASCIIIFSVLFGAGLLILLFKLISSL